VGHTSLVKKTVQRKQSPNGRDSPNLVTLTPWPEIKVVVKILSQFFSTAFQLLIFHKLIPQDLTAEADAAMPNSAMSDDKMSKKLLKMSSLHDTN
jgi:hypothetical protein